jgi:hypothetical protein
MIGRASIAQIYADMSMWAAETYVPHMKQTPGFLCV